MTELPDQTEVLVVGAGPVGSAVSASLPVRRYETPTLPRKGGAMRSGLVHRGSRGHLVHFLRHLLEMLVHLRFQQEMGS